MKLRSKLLAAQLPLVIALALVGWASTRTTHALGAQSAAVLEDNFRSVLAAQRIREAAESLDAQAVSRILGLPTSDDELRKANESLEGELRLEENNITEPGEKEAAQRIRDAWAAYTRALLQAGANAEPRQLYVDHLRAPLSAIRSGAAEILALNEDAIVRKNEDAQRSVRHYESWMVLVALAAFASGLMLSATWTARLLRPLGVVSQAVHRIGEGDLDARINLQGSDEVAALGREFNTMADRLRGYRQSSLGELLQVQAAAQAAIDALGDPVLVLDARGRLVNVNEAAERILGVSVERAGLEAQPDALRRIVEGAAAHVLAGKGAFVPRPGEEPVRAQTKEGERYFVARGSPQYALEGGITGVTVVLQDVTRVRLFDELQNDMVATVAHEFRTPLTSLRMAIHLCLEELAGPLTEKQKDLLQGGREDCERLQAMVDDLLESARIHAGKAGITPRPIAVDVLVDAAVSTHERAAAEAGVQLRAEPAPEGIAVEVDAERAGLVFTNLIGNAIHHTPSGGQVEIRIQPEERFVRFEITDTGPGIPPEYQDRVFDKFFRVPGREGDGAGLGLFIARDVVRAHGGRIGVSSPPEGGSTFWFTLPREGAVSSRDKDG